MKSISSWTVTWGLSLVTAAAFAHYVPNAEYAVSNSVPLSLAVETRGPVRVARTSRPAPESPVSGQGFWKFTPARDRVPVPAGVSSIQQAHGTVIVDRGADVVYWGLQGVGWIGFSNKLRSSWVVAGDPAFTNGNLHGADLLPSGRRPPQVAVADNMSGKVYLTDTCFATVQFLERPSFGSYATNNVFRPTDVAFAGRRELWVVDGYGQQRFMPAEVQPLGWQGEHFGGGQRFSKTLHGVTYDPRQDDLLFSARPEGQLRRVDRQPRHAVEILGLPEGTWLCDVDLWGDYALAACLNGPNKSSGPLYIINLKRRAIVSTIRPKEELGYEDAQHLHDAAWYITGKGRKREVFILFTNWNPGGIGALQLVNVSD